MSKRLTQAHRKTHSWLCAAELSGFAAMSYTPAIGADSGPHLRGDDLMIKAVHALIYSDDPDTTRAFLRNEARDLE